MTEEEARDWIVATFGHRAHDRIAQFLTLVAAENARQNLLSSATLPQIWSRHAADSAQLVTMVPAGEGPWLDVGTGGGFPGMIVALLTDRPVTMVEPRRRRADFLTASVDDLGLAGTATVMMAKIEAISIKANVISARAVADVASILKSTVHCADRDTRWVLPRGRSAITDLTELESRYDVMFHVEQSLTDPTASIVIGDRR